MIATNETANRPTMAYYFKLDCPICKIFERIPREVHMRTSIPVEYIDVATNRGDRYRWWKQLCDNRLGSRVVPVLVFWQNGFENGGSHVMILEKKYTGVVTSSIREQVSVMSKKIMQDLSKYRVATVITV